MPPRDETGRAGQAGDLANTLPEGGSDTKKQNIYSLKTEKKPLKPKRYSIRNEKTLSHTAKRVDAEGVRFSRNGYPLNPPKTLPLLLPYSPTLLAQTDKPAPSADKPLTLGGRVEASSPEVLGGRVFSTPTNRAVSGPVVIPFTPSPEREYQDACELHTALSGYLEREAPEMRATGQHEALRELEQIEAALWEQVQTLYRVRWSN